ncbi:MAG TPA: 50S ribosomal protein L21 [Phycisphaerales bacterium]|nr:50S ribosomal protein L21 [Phycisphaerales bacterium]HMP36647.1 50S ribosomal protein L21 [Phycisphaerales bacterium]
MYAIIEDSGTQIKVVSGDVLAIDFRPAQPGDALTFDRVLLIGVDGGGGAAKIGTPYLAGASVKAEVIEPFLDDKVVSVKYARRKGSRVKKGHRQPYLKVRIGEIVG